MNDIMASVCAVVLGAGVFWSATDGLQAVTTEGARRIAVRDNPVAVPDIRLETMDGTYENLLGSDRRVRLIEFIYTSCPTICQSAGSDLARLRNRLVGEGYGDRTRMLSVSFDPQSDRIPQLREYGDRHGADRSTWSIARPQTEDVGMLLRSFGVVVIPDGFGGYQHNAAIHVVNSSGRLSAILDTDDIEGALAEIAQLLK